MDPIMAFQFRVLRSWKTEELKAKKKVKLYLALIKQAGILDVGEQNGLKFSLESAQREVKLYRKLIAVALKKAKNAK